eukprot:TRINITY_DN8797_c0_g1_i1.p1 TRINITY_DN8797_c0_g1~~TRINITY_DN8797_c0_g1_i1.p1  ORF type:complete len:163 (-),score=64.29 TRINITY_DN8797_c0_g1_i1:113-601(-)
MSAPSAPANMAEAKNMTHKTGIAVGLNRGHIVTKREKRERPSQRKGSLHQRVKMIRNLVREVAGYLPYERRMMEILKGGGNNPAKRAWRFAKTRLGTHRRAKKKVAEMTAANSLIAQRAAQQKKKEDELKHKEEKKEHKEEKPKTKEDKPKVAEKKETKKKA